MVEIITSGFATWRSHKAICTSTDYSSKYIKSWSMRSREHSWLTAMLITLIYHNRLLKTWANCVQFRPICFGWKEAQRTLSSLNILEKLLLPDGFWNPPSKQGCKCWGFEQFTFQRAAGSEESPCICWSALTHSRHLGEGWQPPHIVSSWS